MKNSGLTIWRFETHKITARKAVRSKKVPVLHQAVQTPHLKGFLVFKAVGSWNNLLSSAMTVVLLREKI